MHDDPSAGTSVNTYGGHPGFGASGGFWPGSTSRACDGGSGGIGGIGGYGGGGRGGESIGIAYLDEDQLVLENVTFELGEPGEGGHRGPADPTKSGADGVAVEKLLFPE